MRNDTIKEWFVFTKRERNAAIILLCILSVVIVLPYALPAKKPEIHLDIDLQKELDAYTEQKHEDRQQIFAAADTAINDSSKHSLFYFDPNSLNEEGFIQLGLSPKTAHTIINKPCDLAALS